MLKVKYLTLFKQKNWKKAGILTKVARKIQASYGRFLPTTSQKMIFFLIFVKVTPPGKSQNVKMRNFCNGF